MIRSIALLALAALALAARPEGVAAQVGGLVASVGVGVGSFAAEDLDGRRTGPAGQLTLGWALSERLVLAVEGSLWTREDAGARRTQASALVVAHVHPLEGSGLFVRGGAGVSHLRVSSESPSFSYRVSDSALGVGAGAGYEVPVGPRLRIAPYASFVWGAFDGGSAHHLQCGVAVTWR